MLRFIPLIEDELALLKPHLWLESSLSDSPLYSGGAAATSPNSFEKTHIVRSKASNHTGEIPSDPVVCDDCALQVKDADNVLDLTFEDQSVSVTDKDVPVDEDAYSKGNGDNNLEDYTNLDPFSQRSEVCNSVVTDFSLPEDMVCISVTIPEIERYQDDTRILMTAKPSPR